MSLLAAPTAPANASRRMSNSARITSNVPGTPWPVLWGTRDLSGTLIAWTNHRFNNSGASGKGGGQVSAGEKDFRTFALGLCIGPVDSINKIWYDNQLIWTGNVTSASAAATSTATQGAGSVILTDNANRGTIAFYFGLDYQDQDPILAQFIPNAPFYRGMCYAVFHGPRNGTKGFRIGNADTLAQIAVNITRIPHPPTGSVYTSSESPSPRNGTSLAQTVTVTIDDSDFSGPESIQYILTAHLAASYPTLHITWDASNASDTSGSDFSVANGVPFDVGALGLKVTLAWPNNSSPLLNSDAQIPLAEWTIQVTSNSAPTGLGGANVGAMVYELLTSTIAGFALNPAILDANQFAAFATQANYAALNYMTTEKADARNLLKDILGYVQGALTISNGLLAPRLMGYLPGTLFATALTLEADDIVGYKIRPGAWYELPHHLTVKYRDSGRLYRDTTLSLPGAGDVGNDEKTVEFDLPMVTDLPTARLIGLRTKALETLPKKPDTLVCGRAAFPVQFGDIIALNAPMIGTLPAAFSYQPGAPLVVIAVREYGPGNETIELDVAPDVFGYLPVASTATGSGGEGIPVGPAAPFNRISVQDAFECPYEFATDGQKRFVLFAARTDPDAQGFSLWDSIENPPVDYTEALANGQFHPGGTILDSQMPAFAMDRNAYIDFTAASEDIDSWQSVSDSGWFSYQFLILIGSGDTASLYAAKELLYLGSNVWRIQGIYGPLSDTLPNSGPTGDVWVFAVRPLYNVLGQPAWVLGTTVSFKGIPFGSRLSPTLADALAAQAVVENRALCPRAAVNPVANGLAPRFLPSYGGAGVGNDINLAWDLCNRPFGFGAETNPCEFVPEIASEVAQCQVDVIVASNVVRTATVAVRTAVSTSVASAVSADVFSVASTSGLQPGDRVSVVHGGGEWFGRIASISGSQVTLVSPLSITPSAADGVNRYEACGYVYDAATNLSDNGSLPASITFKIYPYLNGLRALNPASITVTKI